MQSRRLGKTGWDVSEIGYGAWAIGGSWGETDEEESLAALHAAVDAGVTFFDTADVYGDGRSERLIGRLLQEREERLVVATKFGRRVEQDPALFTYENLRGWLERSRENLGVEAVDLVQLHCPPRETYYRPEVFEACDRLVEEGLVRGVRRQRREGRGGPEGDRVPDGVATVQIIFNMFRQRPAELFFDQARRRDVGVIVRVPLASGLLTGKFDRDTTLRRGRPPRVQPPRRGVRRRRDLLRRRLRGRARGRGGAQAARASGCDAGPARAALDPLVRRRLDGHPRREDAGAGPCERRRRRAARAFAETMERVAEIYRRQIAPLVHQRW